MGEIRKGIVRLPEGMGRQRLEKWLETELLLRFSGRILAIDLAIVERWAVVVGALLDRGRPVPAIDSLLAATALVHDLTIVTRNVDDFTPFGVPLVNPWERGSEGRAGK